MKSTFLKGITFYSKIIFFTILLQLFSIQSFTKIKELRLIPKDPDKIRFAFIADIHIQNQGTAVEDMEATLKDINLQKNIDFVILAGDITEFGSDKEIAKAAQIFSKFSLPWFILSGNHDSKWSESGCNTFLKTFGYEFFDFKIGNFRFLGCNSGPDMRMAPALVPIESMNILDSISKMDQQYATIFINHYPLNNEMLNYKELIAVLKKIDVRFAMCGHGHSNRPFNFQGIPAVMGRSNLRSNYTIKDTSANVVKKIVKAAGYSIVEITKSEIVSKISAQPINYEIKISERIVPLESNFQSVTLEAWYKSQLDNHTLADDSSTNEPLLFPKESKVKIVWKIQDEKNIGSAPTVSLLKDYMASLSTKEKRISRVYYVNSAGVAKALDLDSGNLLWSYASWGKVFSTPLFYKGSIFFGSTDNQFYSLNADDGKLNWKISAKKSILSSPVAYEDKIYFGASDGVFRCVNFKNGKTIWSFDKVAGFVESKPFVDSSGVYFGSWGSTFYALNQENGELKWNWTNGKARGYSPAAVWPIKVNDVIYFVTPERKTYALDSQSGKELWMQNGGRESIGSSEKGDYIYVKTMQDTLIAYKTTSPINSISASSTSTASKGISASESVTYSTIVNNVAPSSDLNIKPSVFWKSNIGFGYEISPSPITAANSIVFVPTDKGDIFAVSQSDGTILWKFHLSVGLINYILPIPNTRQILVTTMDGVVALLEYR